MAGVEVEGGMRYCSLGTLQRLQGEHGADKSFSESDGRVSINEVFFFFSKSSQLIMRTML